MWRTFVALFAYFITSQAQDSFDYIIVGGGTCGLVLANRLTEDPNITVAVVEAGGSVKNNSKVTQIKNAFASLNTSIDWQYKSQPQVHTGNRILNYPSGKGLGGTSTINGAAYVRAQKAQIDAWEQLGNQGWNWTSLWHYYKKSEHFQPPTPDLVDRGANFEASLHGYDGPVYVGWTNYTMVGDAHNVINETYQNLGVPYNKDQGNGELRGFSVFPITADSTLEIRYDAARSYLYPVENRTNLQIFTGTLVERLVWQDEAASQDTLASAAGVEVVPIQGGTSRVLTAQREVIVSAGTLKSPVILEMSGVGNPDILGKYGIPVKVNLSSVGENLQDQPSAVIDSAATTNWTGQTFFVTYLTAADLFGDNTTEVMSHVQDQIPAYAAAISANSNNTTSVEVVQTQLALQADLIFNQNVPLAEILIGPSKTSIAGNFWMQLPFSRGSVHLSSSNATAMPLIDPNFFQLDFDGITQTAIANWIRRSFHSPPLGPYVGTDTKPNTTVVPTGTGPEKWLPYLQQIYGPSHHPIGTCAMTSQELGGVVDSNLVVYGTSNVRVVDASILPFQVDGHLTSTLYAVSERAADIIKGNV